MLLTKCVVKMAGCCCNWTPLELAVSVRLIGVMITTEEWQVPTLGVCLG